MTNCISSAQAKKRLLGAQGASVVFVLAAVTLGAVGLPKPSSQASVDLTTTDISPDNNTTPGYSTNPSSTSNQPTGQHTKIDSTGLAERFALLDNAPAVITKAVILEPNTTPDTIETAQGGDMIRKRMQYIGFINDPPSRHAFIRIDGKQRVVAMGGVAKSGDPSMPDLNINQINGRFITVSDGEVSVKIELANRIGQSITMAGGGKVDIAESKPNGSVLTNEDEQYIADLPANLRISERRRLQRERRGLPPRKSPEPQATVRTNIGRNRNQSGN